MMVHEKPNSIKIGPQHPLWSAWDDNDWGAATTSQWLTAFDGSTDVTIEPPTTATFDLVCRVWAGIGRVANSVTVDHAIFISNAREAHIRRLEAAVEATQVMARGYIQKAEQERDAALEECARLRALLRIEEK
jgi:hypothetical protein